MKDTIEFILEDARELQTLIRQVDAKAASLLIASGILINGFIALSSKVFDDTLKKVLCSFFIFSLSFVVIGLVLGVLYPRIRKEKNKTTLFNIDYKGIKEQKFPETCSYYAPDEINDRLTKQIHALSFILAKKNIYLRISCIALAVCFFIFCITLFISI